MFMRGLHSSIWGPEPHKWTTPWGYRSEQGNRLLDVDVEAGLTQFDVAVKPPAIFSRACDRFSIFDCLTETERLSRQSAKVLANFNLNGFKTVNAGDQLNLLAGTARSLPQAGRDGCYILVVVPERFTELLSKASRFACVRGAASLHS
jgi:hypothetical protein